MKHTGTTLVELTATLVIVALLAVGASSAGGGLKARYQVTAAANSALGLVDQQARAVIHPHSDPNRFQRGEAPNDATVYDRNVPHTHYPPSCLTEHRPISMFAHYYSSEARRYVRIETKAGRNVDMIIYPACGASRRQRVHPPRQG